MRRDVLDVDSLTKQFLCCTTLNKINFMLLDKHEVPSFDLDMQKRILDNTIHNCLIKQYPVKTSYQKAFLKLLIQKIKESNCEIHDDLYVAYGALISLPDKDSVHYRHFLIENGALDCITLRESTSLISEGTTGLCSWQGALALSEWCAKNVGQFHEKNILELGCGVGLTGVSVIGTCAPKQYIFTDYHEMVLNMLCENIKLNFSMNNQYELLDAHHMTLCLKLHLKYKNTDVQVMELKWEDIDKHIMNGLIQPDIIIAADILYDSSSFGALAICLKRLLTSKNHAILAATVRNIDTISQFLNYLGDHDLTFEEQATPEQVISIQSIDSPVRILKIFQKILC